MANKRPEPEIIPPGEAGGEKAKLHFHIVQPGPIAAVVVVLITGLLLALLFVMLAGALLFVLPTLILFVTGVVVVAILRAYFRDER